MARSQYHHQPSIINNVVLLCSLLYVSVFRFSGCDVYMSVQDNPLPPSPHPTPIHPPLLLLLPPYAHPLHPFLPPPIATTATPIIVIVIIIIVRLCFQVSWVDVMYFCQFKIMFPNYQIPVPWKEAPLGQELAKRVEEIPNIAVYLAKSKK